MTALTLVPPELHVHLCSRCDTAGAHLTDPDGRRWCSELCRTMLHGKATPAPSRRNPARSTCCGAWTTRPDRLCPYHGSLR